jgi:hypothetical protein
MFGKYPFILFWLVLLQEKIGFFSKNCLKNKNKLIINIVFFHMAKKLLNYLSIFFKENLKYFCMLFFKYCMNFTSLKNIKGF